MHSKTSQGESEMIHHVEGDILLTQAAVIAHGLAPSDHFSSGLALALRQNYPAMAKDFRHFCSQNHPHTGSLWEWTGPGPDGHARTIVNLLTQEPSEDPGGLPGKAKLSHVNHALKALAELAHKNGYKNLSLPRLATGVGGLDWSDVLPLIDKHLGDLGIPVFIYQTYHAGQKADEKL
jgi:O-acetyl-ADP-ribose deacetylase (regulator of RNase III)